MTWIKIVRCKNIIVHCTMTTRTDKKTQDQPLRDARILIAKDATGRAALISVKRSLLSARTMVQEAADYSRRAGQTDLAQRLHAIAERLADELDDLDGQLAKLP